MTGNKVMTFDLNDYILQAAKADKAFMDRLAKNLKKSKVILDKLANTYKEEN